MRQHYLSLTATTLLVLGYSHAALAESTIENKAPAEAASAIECFSTLGSATDHNKEYHLTKNLNCDFSQAPAGTNAAITVLGTNATLKLNGHHINCTNSPDVGGPGVPTNNLASIGVHMAGRQGTLNGAGHDHNSHINGCQVAVEVGTAPVVQGYDHHQIGKVTATECLVGFRVLGNKNLLKSNYAQCGIVDTSMGADPSAGFLVGIRALNPALQPNPINNNLLTLNAAEKNNMGFMGANESKIDDTTIIKQTTNMMSENKARYNIDGFSIQGSGHQLKENLSRENDNGINVSQRNPAAAPPAGSLMNEFFNNRTVDNTKDGIDVGGDNPGVNFGNFLKANYSSGNGVFDFFDANSTCGETTADLATLNVWKKNKATGTVNPACTATIVKDAAK